MSKNKKTDFLFYLLSLFLSTACVFASCAVHSRLNQQPLFTSGVAEVMLVSVLGHLLCVLPFVFYLVKERFFHFEFLTYAFLVFGAIMLFQLKNIKNDIFPATFGFVLESLGLFSRARLWKYDMAKNERLQK